MMKKSLFLLLAVTMCFCVVFSSCKKNTADSASDSAGSDTAAVQNAYNSDSGAAKEEGTSNSTSEERKTSETEQSSQDDKTTAANPTEKMQNKTKTNSSKTSSEVSNNPKPASQDFKSLENILNWDGGEITYADSTYFNYKTASVKRYIEVAESNGFVPAYRVYIDENALDIDNLTDIDNDGFVDTCIPIKNFNWVLKNIYNYSGAEISSSNPCGCNIKGDNIYFWIPPDEGGVYGEFRYKNYTVNDNVYKVKFDFYENISDYGEEARYKFKSVYTVTAAFKTVKNANNTGNINVWSIYSIEK